MKTINVLIFPAGEVNSIELHDALSSCVNIKVFGASSVDRHGPFVFENYISNLPMINAPDFFEKFNAVLKENAIDLIFPSHDSVASFFATSQSKIAAKVIVADEDTSKICRDKTLTYEHFSDCSFVPKVFYETPKEFPVFIKPREGQGAVGARLITNQDEVDFDTLQDHVICEYLPGEEYTVDCLTDHNGVLTFVSPRSRNRLIAGITSAGTVEKLTDEVNDIATEINARLKFLGLWWFQIKKDAHGRWKLLEISTRCAGTMCLTRALGVNLPLLSVYTALGLDIKVTSNDLDISVDTTLIRRYKTNLDYQKVYIDFDDTLTLRGKVNLKAIWFIYQCQNANKEVVLITKHEKNLDVSLAQLNIPKSIFSEIIHLPVDAKKSHYIKGESTIFIDNAYKEREDVATRCNIPVFDVDGLDVLMDWRY